MALYFVDSAKADDTGDGLSWANAKKTIQAALTAAGNAGANNLVIIKSTVDHVLGADTTFTTTESTSVIAATADDTSTAYTPTEMGTANYIGRNDTTNYHIRLDGGADDKVYWYGCTFRTAGSTADNIRVNAGAAGVTMEFENCYFWSGNTATSALIEIGGTASTRTILTDCTFRFGATAQGLGVGGIAEFYNCTISSDGSVPTNCIKESTAAQSTRALFSGCDFTHIAANNLVGNFAAATAEFTFDRCKFASTTVTFLATQTSNPTLGSASILMLDCYYNDTYTNFFRYENALGSCVSEYTIKYTSGAAGQSWKIVTSPNASFWSPFRTPYIDFYNTGTSAITPRFEIFRDGSTTAYQNDEIWAEFSAKVGSGLNDATFYNDRKAINTATSAADQAAGAGYASWDTGTSADWSGKIDSGGTNNVTPAEAGYIRGRIAVGEPSITVYVNPEILTA